MKPVRDQIYMYPRVRNANGIYTSGRANNLVYNWVKRTVFNALYFRVVERIRLKTIDSAV